MDVKVLLIRKIQKKYLKPHRSPCSLATTHTAFDRRGYTLIEIMMVMSIFCIGVLGLMSLHIMAIKSNRHAREITAGSTFLSDRIEKLISMDFASPELAPGATTARVENGYRIERTVSATQIPNIKRIDLAVTRDTPGGRVFTATYYKGNRR